MLHEIWNISNAYTYIIRRMQVTKNRSSDDK